MPTPCTFAVPLTGTLFLRFQNGSLPHYIQGPVHMSLSSTFVSTLFLAPLAWTWRNISTQGSTYYCIWESLMLWLHTSIHSGSIPTVSLDLQHAYMWKDIYLCMHQKDINLLKQQSRMARGMWEGRLFIWFLSI